MRPALPAFVHGSHSVATFTSACGLLAVGWLTCSKLCSQPWCSSSPARECSCSSLFVDLPVLLRAGGPALATPNCVASLGVRPDCHVSAPFFVIFVSVRLLLFFLITSDTLTYSNAHARRQRPPNNRRVSALSIENNIVTVLKTPAAQDSPALETAET